MLILYSLSSGRISCRIKIFAVLCLTKNSRQEKATTLVRAPSSSLILEVTLSVIRFKISSETVIFSRSEYFLRMAIRVSRSGGLISVTRPHSKRDLKRSSRVAILLGGRSLERTIWRLVL